MIFKVIDNRTGKEPIYDFNHLFKEKWFKESALIYCDISGWGIDEDGYLFLIDDCNNMAYPPSERFSAVFDLSEFNERFKTDYISKEDIIRLLKKWSDGYSYIEIPTDDAIKAIKKFKGGKEV